MAGGTDLTDLVVGFGGVTYTNGGTVTLSTGVRTTANNLSIGYGNVNGSGNATLRLVDGTVVSDTIGYTAVPEPAHYAAIFGAVALGAIALIRRRKAA